MKHYKRNYRNTLTYKIKMWFYRLTFRDVRNTIRICGITIVEFIMCIIGFIILIILPAFFY